jgi:hypothetical protein
VVGGEDLGGSKAAGSPDVTTLLCCRETVHVANRDIAEFCESCLTPGGCCSELSSRICQSAVLVGKRYSLPSFDRSNSRGSFRTGNSN